MEGGLQQNNGRQPLKKWKMTSKKNMEDNLQNKMEENLKKKEDNLNYFF